MRKENTLPSEAGWGQSICLKEDYAMKKAILYRLVAGITASLFVPPYAFAAGTGMPWETPMQNLLDSLTGPVAKTIAIASIVLLGLGFALGESGGIVRRICGLVFGVAIAFSAAQWGMTFFGFAGGAGF
jgi:type IV secretory pathway VirB2 component (pilin)